MGSDEDDGNVNVGICQLALEIKPTYARQPDVQYQATRCIGTFATQELLSRAEQLNLQSYRLDESLDRPTNRRIVIHYKNNGGRLSHEAPLLLGGQSKLKKRSLDTWFSPQTASMRLYDRPADGQVHSNTFRFAGEEWFEDMFRLRWI